MKARLGMLAACSLVVGLEGCGGSSAPPPRVEEKPAAAAPEQGPSASEKAQARYADLSAAIEKLGEGKPVDGAWLEVQLKEVLALDSKHAGARFNLAALHEARGDKEGARKIYEQIHAELPDFAPAAENIAAELIGKGEVQRAVGIYRDIVAKDPKNMTSRLALARIAYTEKQYDEAIELCRQVLQRQADALEAFRVLAQSYKAVGNLPMAELIISRGLKVDKDDVKLHFLLAQILLERGDLAGGVNKLKYIITQDPKWLRVRGQLADIALSYRDYGNASQQFEAVLKEQPQNRAAKVGLAVSYKGLGRYEQAEKLYKELLGANGSDVEALWNLAVLYHRHLSRYDDAVAMYKKAKEAGGPGDQQLAEVDTLVQEVDKLKSDLAAAKAREEAERKRREALESACAAVAAGEKPNAEAIGNEQERVEVGWQLMVTAQAMVQEAVNTGATTEPAEALVKCAYAIVPETPKANAEACAPMRVMWTQILYQLGRLEDALASVRAGLKCDPENPDAQLIEQQLLELIQQQGAAAPAATEEAPQ